MSIRLKPGDVFGRWTVQALPEGKKVRCLCQCGTERDVWVQNLTRGISGSCGCAPYNRKKNMMLWWMKNTEQHKHNQHGYAGVVEHSMPGKYRARLRHNGVTKYIGRFDTAKEANEAYLKAKAELYEQMKGEDK